MSKKRLSEKEKDKLYETYKIGRRGSSLIISLFGLIALIAVFNLIHLENQPCGSTCFEHNMQVIGIVFVLFISGCIAYGSLFLFGILMEISRRKLGKEYIKKRRALEKKEYEKNLKNRNKSRKKNRDYTDDSI